MAGVAAAVRAIKTEIESACLRSGRRSEEVQVIAVTKYVPIELIRLAAAEGITDFGENYAADLAEKAPVVNARWHFIGTLQRGNVPRIATHADVVHSAVPGTAIEHLSRRAVKLEKDIPCLIQVDFTGRRNGAAPEDVTSWLETHADLPRIRFVGLMTMPPWSPTPEDARPYFARLRDLRDRLRNRWPDLQELSMGMSADFQVAVEEGATMLRIGTALFGERPQKRTPEGAGRGSRGAKET